MSSEYVYTLSLTPDEADDLQDGVELHFDVPGDFIESNPTIAVRVEETR